MSAAVAALRLSLNVEQAEQADEELDAQDHLDVLAQLLDDLGPEDLAITVMDLAGLAAQLLTLRPDVPDVNEFVRRWGLRQADRPTLRRRPA